MKNNHLKKSYLKPELTVIDTATKFSLLSGSGEVGITSGSTPGNEYNEDDRSYSRSSSYMGDEE